MHTSFQVEHLLGADPRRDVYTAADGTFWISYGGGEVSKHAVRNMLEDGRLVRRWPDMDGCWVLSKSSEQ